MLSSDQYFAKEIESIPEKAKLDEEWPDVRLHLEFNQPSDFSRIITSLEGGKFPGGGKSLKTVVVYFENLKAGELEQLLDCFHDAKVEFGLL